MAHCYLSPDVADRHVGDDVVLSEQESHHAIVARARVGEQVWLTSGEGTLAKAEVTAVERKSVALSVLSTRHFDQPATRITLVQALAKGDRSDIAITAATELGVDAVIPWQAARSVVQWRGDKAVKGVERWRSAVTEAAKQSIRPRIPLVHPLMSTAEIAGLQATLVVLHPDADKGFESIPVKRDLAFIVGPEGGIAPNELERFAQAGAHTVHMGPEVLRTSTAGLASIAAVSMMLGRWRG